MGSLTLQARGAADADEVWLRYADTQRWSEWSPQIRRVDSERYLVAGLSGVVRSWFGIGVPFTVLAVDPQARTWSWQVSLGPARLELRHEVIARAAGSATSLTVRGPLPIVLGYAPAAALALRRLVKAD